MAAPHAIQARSIPKAMHARNDGNVQVPDFGKGSKVRGSSERKNLRKILPGSYAPSGKIFRPAAVSGQPRSKAVPPEFVTVCACSGFIGVWAVGLYRSYSQPVRSKLAAGLFLSAIYAVCKSLQCQQKSAELNIIEGSAFRVGETRRGDDADRWLGSPGNSRVAGLARLRVVERRPGPGRTACFSSWLCTHAAPRA